MGAGTSQVDCGWITEWRIVDYSAIVTPSEARIHFHHASNLTFMTLQISIDELLRYSSEERDKWRQWLVTHPAAMESPVQPAGGFPTIGKLIDHIFIVERRHLQRLQGQPLSSATGLTGNNVPP